MKFLYGDKEVVGAMVTETEAYVAPAVVYEGEIGVRAGPTFLINDPGNPVDPADLFDNN